MSKDNISKKIENLYLKFGFMDRYGSDVWISAILCVIFLILITYFYLFNLLQVVKSDWPKYRCNPGIIPFAGFINKPYDKTNLEYTAYNFTGCVNSFIKNLYESVTSPFIYLIVILRETIASLNDSFNLLRNLFTNVRNTYEYVSKKIHVAIMNIVISFIQFILKTKDTMGKVNGILTTALYSIIGSYMALQSFFKSILSLVFLFLVAMAAFIVLYWAIGGGLAGIPIFGTALAAPFFITAHLVTLIMIVLVIIFLIFSIYMMRALQLSAPPPPGIPSCFSENTLIEVKYNNMNRQNQFVKIKDIKIGDVLKNNEIVTATIKASSSEQNVYNLYNVMVTGEHRVYHNILKWIKVKNHPDAHLITDFNEPYVYCLNTNKKIFTIHDTIYSDWDDIDEKVLNDLDINCVTNGFLNKNFTYDDIHTQLDSGFISSTILTLQNGESIPISNIKINDILKTGEKVLGIITILGKDMIIYKHIIDNNCIYGTKNIHFNNNNLGTVNCMYDDNNNNNNNNIVHTSITNKKEDCIYHLLTDSTKLHINNLQFNDYNSGIDIYII